MKIILTPDIRSHLLIIDGVTLVGFDTHRTIHRMNMMIGVIEVSLNEDFQIKIIKTNRSYS